LRRFAQPQDGSARGRRWLWIALFLYASAMLLVVPQGVGTSWRECDTQAIARNFVSEGFDPLRPRIDWRGDTDGAVECEFPLYQLMIGAVMAGVGESEWPGRLLALLSMIAATLSLHRLLEARVGWTAALAGALVFLSGGHSTLLGARVMPDATSTALALVGLTTYARFLITGSGVTLLVAAAATALGALAKPTALQVGLIQFLWTLALVPRRLLEVRVWVAFGAILGVVALWLWHARSLFLETGLTFGVVSGGDTKFPDLEHLLMPELHWQMLRTTGRYGFGVLGMLGVAIVVLRRRFDMTDAAVLLSAVLGLIGSFRYSHSSGLGPHYHVWAAVAGAWFCARALAPMRGRLAWLLVLAAVIGQFALHLANERKWRTNVLHTAVQPLAAAVRDASSSDELLIVHGKELSFDASWQRRYNYEEPILLYNAHRRGWVLARDGVTSDDLAALRQRGARFFVDQVPDATPAEAKAWLTDNARLLSTHPGGQIFRLLPVPDHNGDRDG